MKIMPFVATVAAVSVMLITSSAISQDVTTGQSSTNPLQPFERLIGGQWHLGESYQELEWGVGRQSVKARSYFVIAGEAKLVSEGVWYWHPGEQQIKGLFTAIDMPVVLFDYTTRFEGDTMVNDLRAYATNGKETIFRETWKFTDDTHYEWKLTSVMPDGSEAVMSDTYTRRPSPPR